MCVCVVLLNSSAVRADEQEYQYSLSMQVCVYVSVCVFAHVYMCVRYINTFCVCALNPCCVTDCAICNSLTNLRISVWMWGTLRVCGSVCWPASLQLPCQNLSFFPLLVAPQSHNLFQINSCAFFKVCPNDTAHPFKLCLKMQSNSSALKAGSKNMAAPMQCSLMCVCLCMWCVHVFIYWTGSHDGRDSIHLTPNRHGEITEHPKLQHLCEHRERESRLGPDMHPHILRTHVLSHTHTQCMWVRWLSIRTGIRPQLHKLCFSLFFYCRFLSLITVSAVELFCCN